MPLRKFNPRKVSITIIRKDVSPSVVSSPSSKEVEDSWILVTSGKKKGESSAVAPAPGLINLSAASSSQVEASSSAAAEPESSAKEAMGGDIFCSPISSFKEGSKVDEDTCVDMDTLLENDDFLGEDMLNIQQEKEFIEELEKDLAGASPTVLMPSNNKANSNSGSLKRRGEDDGGDDTASSSLMRKKIKGGP